MGRYAGYIACHASIASGAVDLCLIPELKIRISGPNNHFDHLRRVLGARGHAVVVVAEGAGEQLLGEGCVGMTHFVTTTACLIRNHLLCHSLKTDAGGNRKLPPIGLYLKDKIVEYVVP